MSGVQFQSTVEVCRNFQRGACDRHDCKYAHAPPDSDGKATACLDFLKNRCNRDQCRYYHPPPNIRQSMTGNAASESSLGGGYPSWLASGGSGYVGSSGASFTESGRYRVDDLNALTRRQQEEETTMLALFQTQRVQLEKQQQLQLDSLRLTHKGQQLEFLEGVEGGSEHRNKRARLEDRGGYSDMLPSGFGAGLFHTAAAMANGSGGGMMARSGGRPQDGRPTTGNKILQVCRDFMRGKCHRGSCSFAHPPPHVQLDEASKSVTICMDHKLRECTRVNCRFYHHTSGTDIDDAKAKGIVPVCREHVRGGCSDESCSLPHPPSNVQVEEQERCEVKVSRWFV